MSQDRRITYYRSLNQAEASLFRLKDEVLGSGELLHISGMSVDEHQVYIGMGLPISQTPGFSLSTLSRVTKLEQLVIALGLEDKQERTLRIAGDRHSQGALASILNEIRTLAASIIADSDAIELVGFSQALDPIKQKAADRRQLTAELVSSNVLSPEATTLLIQAATAALNASNLTSGTVPDARLSFTLSAFTKTVLPSADASAWRVGIGAISQADGDSRYAQLAAENTFSADIGVSHAGVVLYDLVSTDNGPVQFRMKSDVATNRRFLALGSDGVVDCQISFSTDGTIHFAGAASPAGDYVVMGASTFTYNGSDVRTVASTPDGSNALAIAGTDTTTRAWDATDLKAAAETWGGTSKRAILQDQKTSGTAGGTATAGSWYTRDLNTEVSDPGGIVSLSGSAFTPTEDCIAIATAMFANTSNTQLRLYNVTDSVVAALGVAIRSSTAGTGINAGVEALLTAGKQYRVEARVTSTETTTGNGIASSWGTEVYMTVLLIAG